MAKGNYKSKPAVVQVNNILFYDVGYEFDHKDEAKTRAKEVAKEQDKRYVVVKYTNIFRKEKFVVMLAPK